MVHTLAGQIDKLPPAFWAYWGLVVFDEGDVLAAKHFNPVVAKFACERWLLTATPKRDDGMDEMFSRHIGPVCFTALEHDIVPECHFKISESTDVNIVTAGWDYLRKCKRVSYVLTARELMFDDKRNRMIFGLIEQATDKGRTCLVLGDSVEGLAHVCSEARTYLPHVSHGLVVGRVKQKERATIINNNRVVWATTQLAYRGLDRPSFDTLILLTTTAVKESLAKQAIGRILRAQKDKRSPVVLVIADEQITPFMMQAAKLAKMFKRFGWRVHNAAGLMSKHTDAVRAYREAQKAEHE
jgi:superfamily II DNA or RNA helicase